MRRSRRTHENPAFRRGFLKNAVDGLTALMALAALSALSALSALLIAAVRVLLLLLAGLLLAAALLLAARIGLLLTTALRIVLILVRIGHDCDLSWRRATHRSNGRKTQTFRESLSSRSGTRFWNSDLLVGALVID